MIDFVEHFIDSQDEAEQFADSIAVIEQGEDPEQYVKLVFQASSQFVIQKFEEKQEKKQLHDGENISEDYEKLEIQLQKYEKDVRQHISLEQQLKLYLDSLQEKLDEKDKTMEQQEIKHQVQY